MLSDTYSFAQRKVIHRRCPRATPPPSGQQFAEQGLLGLPFAEDYGGFGGGAQEVMLVMQAFGRALVLEPYFPDRRVGRDSVERCRGHRRPEAHALLPAIAEGSLKMAFAHGERQARYDLNRRRDNRQAQTAPDGCWTGPRRSFRTARPRTRSSSARAPAVTATTRTASHCFSSIPAASGLALRAYVSRDDTRAADISLSNVSVSDANVLGEVGNGTPHHPARSSTPASPQPPAKPSARWKR